jgi:hypothetical protein
MTLRLTAARPEAIARWLAWSAGTGLAICALSAIYALAAWGSWPAARFLLAYVAPMCSAVPWWARERLRAVAQAPGTTAGRLMLDTAVVGLAIARFGIGELLPFSGHMLFLGYSLLTTSARGYRLAALALLIETTIFKLVVWQDIRSWVIGLVLGLVAAALAHAGQHHEAVP